MQPYRELPILRDAKRLLLEIERIVRVFSRYHKYTIGSELRTQCHRMVRYLIGCIHQKRNRLAKLETLFIRIEDIKTQIHLAKELNAFQNFKQFETLASLAMSVSKQSKLWHQQLQRQSQNQRRNPYD